MYSKTNNMNQELQAIKDRKDLIKKAGAKLCIPENFDNWSQFDMQFALKIQSSSNVKLRQFINGEILKL